MLLKRVEINDTVVVYVPRRKAYSAKADVSRARLLAPWVDMVYHLALNGEYEKAMVLNGLLYCTAFGFSPEPIVSALAAGAELRPFPERDQHTLLLWIGHLYGPSNKRGNRSRGLLLRPRRRIAGRDRSVLTINRRRRANVLLIQGIYSQAE